MTTHRLLERLLERLSCAEGRAAIIGADEAAQWPNGTLSAFTQSGLLKRAEPARVIECNGCEQNCFMPVQLRPAADTRPAHAFIACDKREDVGRVPVEFRRLEQWHFTGVSLAETVARLLGFAEPPHADASGRRWILGLLNGEEQYGEIALSMESGVALTFAGQSIPLAHALTLTPHGLFADRNTLVRILEGSTGIGSALARTKQARTAAYAKHRKPGGSHEKQQQMREKWANGKYTSRDRCAEEECGALGMSYSAARKALRNTPEPKAA